MWGDDYPHPEGTWPHTRESMAHTFCDIDPKHVRPAPRRRRHRRVPPRPGEAAGRRRPDRALRRRPLGAARSARGRDARPVRLPLRGELHLMDDTVSVAAPCRDVTADEIEHLHEHGWVKLTAFVDPDALGRRARRGARADGRRRRRQPAAPLRRGRGGRGRRGGPVLQRPQRRGRRQPRAPAGDRAGRRDREADAAATRPATARPSASATTRTCWRRSCRRRRRRATAATARRRSTRTSSPSPSTGPEA